MAVSRRLLPVWLWAATLAIGLCADGLRHLPPNPPLRDLEDTLIDLRFRIRGPRPPPEGVLIVTIDDPSLESIGLMAPMREALATAIQRLETTGAASIVIDLMLIESTPADSHLAAVLKASPTAVLAVAAVPGDAEPVDPRVATAVRNSAFPVVLGFEKKPPASWRLVLPTRQLAVAAASLGHVNIALSPDRVARRVPLAVQIDEGAMLPSAALVAAYRAQDALPDTLKLERGRNVQFGHLAASIDDAGQVLLNPFGGPQTIETVSLNDLLSGRIDPQRLEGRAVFIGASAATLGDIFATPFAADVAGVEVLGTLAANLIDDELMRTGRTVWLGTTLLTLTVVALSGLAVSVPASALVAAGTTACVWLLALVALQLAFDGRYVLDAATVIAAALLAAAAHWLWRLRSDQRRRRELEMARARLSGYLSPFAATIVPPDGRAPASRTEAATIGFVDVVGSVGLAEARSPDETAAYLARIQGHIAGAAGRHGGAVVERAGDGALVVFGFGGAGGAREALDFARDVIHTKSEDARMRVSLQYGPVTVADLGAGDWGHIALAGDTVNVAARLQDAAKRAGSSIVVGRAVFDAAGIDLTGTPSDLILLPPELVRGRVEAVEVWAVVV